MHQQPIIIVKLLAFLIFIPHVHSNGQTASPEIQVDQLFAGWNNSEIPGASIAIIKDGEIIYKKAYGLANLEYHISNSPATVFQIASVSKQVTAFAILLLESQGKLSLNDDIRKFLPELPDYGKVLTLKQLLNHTSGLRDVYDMLCMAGWRYDDVITQDQILNMVCRQKELNYVPGTEYQYSNTGYVLLAEVVARVSGQSFAGFTRDNIFNPLHMNNSIFCDDHEKIVSNQANSYYPDGTGFKKNIITCSSVGSSNLYTTVEDMSQWALNFENPRVGNKELIRKMDERGTLINGDTISYALGQDVIEYKGLKVIEHGGAIAGYRSVIGRFPEQHFSVIIFSNNAAIDPTELAIKISEIYLKDQFAGEKPLETAPAPLTGNEFTGSTEMLADFCGRYELRPEFIIDITSGNDKLFVEAHEVPKTQLFRVSEYEFTIPAMNAGLTFAADSTGTFNQLNIVLNGQQMAAHKLTDFDANSINPDDYKGDYFSPELGTVYTFVTQNGKLVARHTRLNDMPLTAVRPDKFSTGQGFLNRIEFIRDEKNLVTGCVTYGGRIRNIKFVKIN